MANSKNTTSIFSFFLKIKSSSKECFDRLLIFCYKDKGHLNMDDDDDDHLNMEQLSTGVNGKDWYINCMQNWTYALHAI